MPRIKPKPHSVRTGYGDAGETKLRGTVYSKTHPLLDLLGKLDMVLSQSSAAPAILGKHIFIRGYIQQAMFISAACLSGVNPEIQYGNIQVLQRHFERQTNGVVMGAKPLRGFIRSRPDIQGMMMLRCAIRDAELAVWTTKEYVEKNEPGISLGLLDALPHIGKLLNIMSDYIFALVWLKSIEAHNHQVAEKDIMRVWPQTTYKRINSATEKGNKEDPEFEPSQDGLDPQRIYTDIDSDSEQS